MDQYIVIIPIIIFSILLFFAIFGEPSILKRKLKRTNTKSIKDFKDGEIAKIVGHIEFVEDPLVAPLSSRECAYYHIQIEQSQGRNRWDTIIDEEKTNRFLVKDGGAFAFINQSNTKSHIIKDANFSSGILDNPTELLEQFLTKRGFKSKGFLGFNKRLRYNEGILERDEKVAVLGKGTWKEAILLGLPEHYGKVLEITSDKDPVYFSDDPDTTLKKVIRAKKQKQRKERKRSRNSEYRKKRR